MKQNKIYDPVDTKEQKPNPLSHAKAQYILTELLA
jgi:hypothetical protein